MARRRLTIGKVRSGLYKTARVLGDVQAARTGKLGRRVARCAAGEATGRLPGRLFE